jgi:hypothetical protein
MVNPHSWRITLLAVGRVTTTLNFKAPNVKSPLITGLCQVEPPKGWDRLEIPIREPTSLKTFDTGTVPKDPSLKQDRPEKVAC